MQVNYIILGSQMSDFFYLDEEMSFESELEMKVRVNYCHSF